MIKDLVSIVIPTYNDEKYLEDAINDLVGQTYENIEIIIINDGSTDGTANILSEIVRRYPDKKIRVFDKENGGTGSALNLGFSLAEGEFGTWVSSDDRKNSDYVETLVTFLKNNRDIELVVSAFDSDYVGKMWRVYTPSKFDRCGYRIDVTGIKHDSKPTGQSFIVDSWVDVNNVQCHMGINYMFTMALKNRCGDYLTIPGEDYYMAVKMGLNTRVGYIDKVLGKHCAPPDSLSVTNRACVIPANQKVKELINNFYKRWYLQNIPKVMHVYFGSPKMSYLRAKSICSFKKMNPDWSLVLYSPKEINFDCDSWKDTFHRCDINDYVGEDFSYLLDEYAIRKVTVDFDSTSLGNNVPEAHKSDFLRWFLLYKYGGFWMDSDILFFKSMSDCSFNEMSNVGISTILMNYGLKKYPGIEMNSIGFLGSNIGNRLFSDIYKEAIEVCKTVRSQENLYQTLGSYTINSIIPTFETALFKYPTEKLFNLDPDTVYAIDYRNLDAIFRQDNIEQLLSKNCVGLHWYGGSSAAQKYNNKIPRQPQLEYNKNTVDSVLELIESKSFVIGN